MQPLRVLVNLLYLRPGQVGGSEIYCRELLSALARRGDLSLRLALLADAAPSFAHLGAERVVFQGPYSLGRRLALENGALRRFAASSDVLFSPANFGLAWPSPCPEVVTVHDLQHAWFPEHFTRRKWLEREAMFRWTVRTAARVIAISDFTRADLEARYAPPPGRVVTVLEGVDLGAVPTAEARRAVRERLGLTRPFFAYPATDNPHKDHRTAIAALAILREKRPDLDVELVFTGARTERYQAVQADLDARGLAGHVRHLGFLPHGEIFALLAESTALLFPSRFEGFGLPVLEAMHSGAPVIASRAASIPEVAGTAALLVEPGDAAGFADAMIRVLTSPALRDDLARAGKQNLTRFSWERCAEMTTDVFLGAARSRT